MKKYLIFSIILISSLFIFDKVKAFEYTEDNYLIKVTGACNGRQNNCSMYWYYNNETNEMVYRFERIYTSITQYHYFSLDDYPYFFINYTIAGVAPTSINMCTSEFKYNVSEPQGNNSCYYARMNALGQIITESSTFTIDVATNATYLSNFDVYDSSNNLIFQKNVDTAQEPEATYEIEDGSNYGKKLIFHFSNFDSDSYFTITNLSSGTTFTIDDLSDTSDYFVDDISYDSVFYVEAYNNDELVFVDTIDINQDLVLNGNPYIDLVLDKERLISYLEFYELKSNYKVYYSINNGTFNEVQVQSGNNHVLVAFTNDMPEIHNTNYTIRGQIRDSEDNILYDKAYNIVFFDNLPYFTFKTSYNNNTGCNEVNITYHNYQSGDIVSYSYDNSNFNNFSYDRYEYLDICSNTPIYTKAVRGSNTYYGYFYVNVMEYESTSNEQYYSYNGDLFSTFNSLFNGVDISFLNNISSTWNSLKSTYVFKFILLCIVGAMILFIMKLIRR